jgi:hypothetical protein
MSDLYGVLCQVLWFSSLAYDTINTVTLELSTPRNTAPDSVLLCVNNEFSQSLRDLAVKSLQQGGTIWQTAGRELIPAAPRDWNSSSFFSESAQHLAPVSMVDASAVLRSDPYYAASFGTAAVGWVLFLHTLTSCACWVSCLLIRIGQATTARMFYPMVLKSAVTGMMLFTATHLMLVLLCLPGTSCLTSQACMTPAGLGLIERLAC